MNQKAGTLSRECNATLKLAISQHPARKRRYHEADVEAVLAPIWFQRFIGVDAVTIERLTAQDPPNDIPTRAMIMRSCSSS